MFFLTNAWLLPKFSRKLSHPTLV